jgi:predicted dehydrogenase
MPEERILVIGGGYGAKIHAPAFAAVPDVSHVGVAGRGHAPAATGDKIESLPDWRAALDRGGWTAAVVAAPPNAQIDIARRLAEAAVPALIEKPCGTNGAALSSFARETIGMPFAAGFSFRFVRGMRELAAQARDVGSIRTIRVAWRTAGWGAAERPWTWRNSRDEGGGVIREFATHVFDYLSLFAQGDWRVESAATKLRIRSRRDAAGVVREVDAPDGIDIVLACPMGPRAEISIDAACPQAEGHRIEIHGDRAMLSWNHAAPFDTGAEVLFRRDSGGQKQIALAPDADARDSRLPAAMRQAAAFVDAVRGRTHSGIADLAAAAAVWRLVETTEAAAAI